MKIPFTLDAWLKDKNQKIVTESDLPVEIIHIEDDCADELPIIAMIGDKPRRIVQAYSADGEPENEIGDLYLFIVTPEPEMSEFEKAVSKYRPQSDTLETIQRIATELLSLARNEFNKQIENDYREIIHGAYERGKAEAEQVVERRLQSGELLTQEHHNKLMEIQYKETLDRVKKNWHDYFTPQAVTDIYNAGRNDVLKDLPRWRIWENGACGNSEGYPIALVHGACGIRFVSCLGTNGEKYIMLSDLEKLPGFKDESHE